MYIGVDAEAAQQVVSLATQAIEAYLGKKEPYRLWVIGSFALGEAVQSPDGRFLSDMEMYVSSPRSDMARCVEHVRKILAQNSLPLEVDINGASPDTMDNFRVRQWLIDAAQGRALVATRGYMDDPFFRFKRCDPPLLDGVTLVLNRIAESLDSRHGARFQAKLVLDLLGAWLIGQGRHKTGYRRRVQEWMEVKPEDVSREFIELVEAARALREDPTDAKEQAWLASWNGVRPVMARELARVLGGLCTALGVQAEGDPLADRLARVFRRRGWIETCRDWARHFRRHPRETLVALCRPQDRRLGPTASAWVDALRQFLDGMDRHGLGRWTVFCKET